MTKKLIWSIVESVLVFFILIYCYCSILKSITFHPDEGSWIATSYYFELFIKGNTSSNLWDESVWTKSFSPLPRYLIGIGRSIGGFDVSDLNSPWDFEKDKNTNINEGRMPSEMLLWWSRLPMAILAALSIFTGYILLRNANQQLAAYIWVVLCICSKYLPMMLITAMSDSPLLATTAPLLLVSYKLLRNSTVQKGKPYWQLFGLIALYGIIVGLAESSKLNGISPIAAGIILPFIIAFRNMDQKIVKIRFVIISSYILILSSQITFIALNPYIWPDPLYRYGALFGQRLYEIQMQQKAYPQASIGGVGTWIQIVPNRILHSFATINSQGFLTINLILLLVGLIYLLYKSFRYLKNVDQNPLSLVILFICITSAIPPLFTPLDWPRYYLLPVYFSTLVIAVGLAISLLFGYGSVRKMMIRQKIVENP